MTERESPPGMEERDRSFMRRALALARRGWGRTAPNPMVGAVVVRDGIVVGEGWHAEYGHSHAEPVALEAAGERARGGTMYVSLEPCAHHGKTPPCVQAVASSGVRRVVIATLDRNPQARGGAEQLAAAGIETVVGLEEETARELNAPFFHALSSDRPFIRLKLALSIDGAIADSQRSRGWLTGARARRLVHRLRADSDAVAVGIGTAIADNPALTVRGVRAPRVSPRRVIFDRQARLPLASDIVRSARVIPVTLVTSDPAPPAARGLADAGVEIVAAPSLGAALRDLRSRGVRSMLVEGGAGIAGALLGESLVDRLVILRAPILLGEGALPAFASAPAQSVAGARRWRIVEQRMLGDDMLTTYAPASS